MRGAACPGRVRSPASHPVRRRYEACARTVLVALPRIFPSVMSDIYDVIIIHMTEKWYAAVLARLPKGARVLDVGIGTATALVGRKGQNATVVVEKDLTFVGVDYEDAYIRKAIDVVRKAKLEKHVDLHCRSIYDAELASMLSGAARCDAAYFSGSLTLMPDPPAALRAAADMCKPKGLVYVTQTFQNAPSPVMARLKPLLRHLTTIDFGRLTYRSELDGIIKAAGMKVLEDVPVPGSIDTKAQTARLLVLSR